ncbi:4'-phosphopantetheinyl transferase superfamily protein [Streptomyces mutabilis]|uniref:4'-phosphopantetheinyl transferase family protein n=1 Tax=Streptomyces mutabilis TaxID=67332 RepID=UPI0022BA63E5|nr:4'-phosphopantetheinyl transferase superfamily protein [Streptomyces mutabilis]MCZ9353742.1 4'-phosphopantetheinyl transferase superfamily protein [Streptomyces mutabilis]
MTTARGTTPSGEDTAATVWICPDDAVPPPLADTLALHWLDRDEWAAAERRRFEGDRRQYRLAHVLVRRALSLETGLSEAELDIARSALGRPCLRPPPGGFPCGAQRLDFNLSHTEGVSALAVTRHGRVGIDVERPSRIAGPGPDTVVAAFADEERQGLRALGEGRPRERAATRLWTLKEAYVKARGIGLGLPFDSFAFMLDDAGRVAGFRPPEDDVAARWRFLAFRAGPDAMAAVAVADDGRGGPAVLVHQGFPWRKEVGQRLRFG